LRELRLFLEVCRHIGISGLHNFPTVGWFDGEFRRTLEQTGLGFQRELDMLNIARELDLLTVGYAFNAEDTERLMRAAAPDIFIFHAGITRGGATGYAGGSSLADTAARSREHFAIARRAQPDVILLAHGAALAEPEDAQYLLDQTDCQGIQLGSAIERLAMEQPLEARAASFKAVRFRRGE
jgi:predicted TIM-barrel enzyme